MKKGKNKPERLLEEIIKLDSVQFLGICKILGIDLYKNEKEIEKLDDEGAESIKTHVMAKDFSEIWIELCDVIGEMNRTRRRNLGKLVYAATKKEKGDEE